MKNLSIQCLTTLISLGVISFSTTFSSFAELPKEGCDAKKAMIQSDCGGDSSCCRQRADVACKSAPSQFNGCYTALCVDSQVFKNINLSEYWNCCLKNSGLTSRCVSELATDTKPLSSPQKAEHPKDY